MTPRIPALLIAGAVVITGCSSDESAASTESTTAATSATTEPTTTGPPEAASTTASSTTAGEEFASWCDVASTVDRLSEQSDLVDYTDPVAVEEYLGEFVPALQAAVAEAPDEIARAVATSADIAGQLRDALAAAEYDMLVADLSLIDELDPEREAAERAIESFNAEHCGIDSDPGDRDTVEPDDEFSFSDGSLRDQFIGQLVASGFTLPEAACVFDRLDFSDPSEFDDPSALFPVFEQCDISAERLEEIGEAVAPGLVDDDLLVRSLASLGLEDDQIECVAAELSALPSSEVDEDVVTSVMLGCEVSMDQISARELSSAADLEALYVDQFVAMGVDQDDARCLYDELIVGNIDGITADEVLAASAACGIDPATLD